MQAVFFSVIALILLQSPSLSTSTATSSHHHNRRILHHPLFPLDSSPPTQPPTSSPHPKTNHIRHPPSSAHPLSSTATNPDNPFFPSLQPPPPATSSTPAGYTAIPTFPANISSLAVPHSHSSAPTKLVAVAVVLCLVAASLLLSLALLRHRHRHDHHRHFKQSPQLPEQTPHSDNVLLYPPYSATSDGRPPKLLPRPGFPITSSELLYLGTLASSTSREFEPDHEILMDSPEIRPLPPLPKQNLRRNSDSESTADDGDEFYSPAGSSERIESVKSSTSRRALETLERVEGFQIGAKFPTISSYSASNSSSPANSVSGSSKSRSPENIRQSPPIIQRIPPPPPPPPARGREPPVLPQPPRSIVGLKSGEQQQRQPQERSGNCDCDERNDEIGKPKLKGLHWDKVRASSDRAMVWDQLEPASFALNEEMIETLFKVNASSTGAKDLPRKPIMPNQEYRVLDPKKSQNIAILLRALNVTVEEVCDALLEGNADMLGTELLGSLLKMTPTEEEERKLKEYDDESALKLGPAEKFLKAVLDIPFAFKRADAMLYIANFDSETDYLRRSFETLEVACEELRNSRMFLKLLEAVLKTGNRMNIGTNRGDAHAFKLDTLLKLVDVKGTDGKTTLLHFVVQEIIRAENSQTACNSLHDDLEARKRGLHVISSLCGELMNVKKAALVDSDVLANDVQKLISGIVKVEEVARLNEECGPSTESHCMSFADTMNEFLKKAGGEIASIRSEERASLYKVKQLTEYFHGNSVKEEAHPLRIFMVVRDFLAVLDQVCKEVARINERMIISSNRQLPMPVNPTLPTLFPGHNNSESQNDERSLSS